MNALGPNLYNDVYQFLVKHRRLETDEADVQAELRYMVNNNKQLLNHIFNLDCIIFMELQ